MTELRMDMLRPHERICQRDSCAGESYGTGLDTWQTESSFMISILNVDCQLRHLISPFRPTVITILPDIDPEY